MRGRSTTMEEETNEYSSGPFGAADGSAQVKEGFVRFSGGRWGDLEFSDRSFRSRVFVGRRGSGKSRYLREYERAADKDFLVFRQKIPAVSLTHLAAMHREIQREAERESFWVGLWRAAIYLSLGTFILNDRRADRSDFSESEIDRLQDILAHYLDDSYTPLTVITCLNKLLSRTDCNRKKLVDLCNDSVWESLQYLVEKSTETTKPLALFIDSLDENFRRAPTESAECQLGLLLYIGQSLADPNQSNRVHLFITVRDVVISQFQMLEHGERYTDDVHWKILDWTKDAARYFFERKIEMLPRNLLRTPTASDLFERWLGVRLIENSPRGGREEVGEFLLRHTRFLPREIVELGNALCNALSAREFDTATVGEDIWSIVIRQSRRVGDRALEVLFDHFIARAGEVFSDDKAEKRYRNHLKAGFRMFIQELGNDVFDEDTLHRAQEAFSLRVGDEMESDVLSSLLWQHGLLGYIHRDEAVDATREIWLYYHAAGGVEGSTAFILPSAERYRLHACLVDTRLMEVSQGAPLVDSTDSSFVDAA
jgi:hypothetical protein